MAGLLSQYFSAINTTAPLSNLTQSPSSYFKCKILHPLTASFCFGCFLLACYFVVFFLIYLASVFINLFRCSFFYMSVLSLCGLLSHSLPYPFHHLYQHGGRFKSKSVDWKAHQIEDYIHKTSLISLTCQ